MKEEGNAEGAGEFFESEEFDHDDGAKSDVAGDAEGENATIHADQSERRRHEREQDRRDGADNDGDGGDVDDIGAWNIGDQTRQNAEKRIHDADDRDEPFRLLLLQSLGFAELHEEHVDDGDGHDDKHPAARKSHEGRALHERAVEKIP